MCLALLIVAVCLAPGPIGAQIVGGEEVPLREAPWQVQLHRTGSSAASFRTPEQAAEDRRVFGRVLEGWEHEHVCGGAYLGERWILTAAHCIGDWAGKNDAFFEGREVRIGIDDIGNGGGAVLALDAVVRHARFTKSTNGFDIALLRLAQSPDSELFGELGVRPIRLRNGDILSRGAPLEVTGWGLTGATDDSARPRSLTGELQRVSPRLMLGEIALLDHPDCDENRSFRGALGFFPILRRIPKLRPGQICAGSDNGVDSCKGDSGGPLVWMGPDAPVLIGLVSFGPGCGLPNTPAVYADVGHFHANGWIEQAKAQARAGMIIDYDAGKCRHDGAIRQCLGSR